MPLLTVLTAHGDAVYEVPTGMVATIWGGFELDTDLLSGKGATLCTDPARIAESDKRYRPMAPCVWPSPSKGRRP